MNIRIPMLIALSVAGGISSAASASLTIGFNDPAVLSPCDDATVTVEWMGSDASLAGTLSWINPSIINSTPVLFESQSAIVGDTVVLGQTYALGERVDFQYAVGGQNPQVFRTDRESDWSQFVVEQIDPLTVMVYIEDVRFPNGDGDFNDAVFQVSFNHVPAPGPSALFGAGMVLMGARRRR